MDNPMIRFLEERARQPFAPVNDDVFILVLLVAGFLLVIALADKTCYLRQLVASYSIGHSRQFSDEVRSSRSVYIRFLLLLQTCLSFSLCVGNGLFASEVVTSRPDMLKALLFCAIGAAVWLLIKLFLFSFVNSILFFPLQRKEWNKVYADTFIMLGIVLFFFAVVSTFFHLSANMFSIITLTMVAVAETWLSVKAFHIFFGKKYGGLHLLLYLCTLEWIPFLAIGKFFVQSSL